MELNSFIFISMLSGNYDKRKRKQMRRIFVEKDINYYNSWQFEKF